MKVLRHLLTLACLLLTFLILPIDASSPLTTLADRSGTDKGSQGHAYTDLYDKFFSPIRDTTTRICEIGIADGASLQLWADYFPIATIFGIDIDDKSWLQTPRIKTFIADQAARGLLAEFVRKYGGDFDFILDDGGHTMEQQQVSFGYLFPHVKSGGYYIIEDLHTSVYHRYKLQYGATPDEKNTTLRLVEEFVRSGRVMSSYMTDKEKAYATENIQSCVLLSQNKGGSITCLFKKK